LGVSTEDVFTDYLLTNEQLVGMTGPISADFAAAGGDPALLAPVLGVERTYLETAIGEMHDRYGDIDRYFTEGLSLSPATIAKLRSDLLI
jgi:protein-tyrosine phosphatase